MWNSLRHPNVLPLLGALKDGSQFKLAMVSEWMPNGNINEFVRAHREVNRFELVRFSCVNLRDLLISRHYTNSIATWCYFRIGSFARPTHGPWRSQGGMSFEDLTVYLPLTAPVH